MSSFGNSFNFISMLKGVQTFPVPLDFTFHVGKYSYQTYKLFACMISPAVVHALQGDATIEEFNIDYNGDVDIFPQLLNIFTGVQFRITDSNAFDVYQIASQLKNEDLLTKCSDSMFAALTKSNVFDKLNMALKQNISTKPFIDFIATNFQEVSLDEALIELPLEVIIDCLKNKNFSVQDTTWLVKWIERVIEKKGDKYCVLIESLNFADMEPKDICEILEMVNSSNITSEICLQMKSFFIDMLRSKHGGFSFNVLSVEFRNSNDHLHGIFNRLTSKYGNIVEKGLIDIIVPCNGPMACDLINYTNKLNSHWKNNASQDQNWIIFDFKVYSVKLKAYTLRGCYCQDYKCRPKSWIISGSNDKENWTILSEIRGCTQMNRPYGMMTFEISNDNKPFRFIKYTQLENNEKNLRYIVHLSAVEFFGSLVRS